jgi:hypothetical protein
MLPNSTLEELGHGGQHSTSVDEFSTTETYWVLIKRVAANSHRRVVGASLACVHSRLQQRFCAGKTANQGSGNASKAWSFECSLEPESPSSSVFSATDVAVTVAK